MKKITKEQVAQILAATFPGVVGTGRDWAEIARRLNEFFQIVNVQEECITVSLSADPSVEKFFASLDERITALEQR